MRDHYIDATGKSENELIKDMKKRGMTDNDIKILLKHLKTIEDEKEQPAVFY